MNTPGGPSLTKEELRRSIRTKLREQPAGSFPDWSASIRRWLQSDESWLPGGGGVVALFGGVRTEPDLLPLLPWLSQRGVRAAFFAVAGEGMTPFLVGGPGDLHRSVMGVLEPTTANAEPVPIERLDAVLVPGIAFSAASGARLGRGKGYYDRVLDRLPAASKRIGVCFEMQLYGEVPCEAHDRRVQRLVTEGGWREPAH